MQPRLTARASMSTKMPFTSTVAILAEQCHEVVAKHRHFRSKDAVKHGSGCTVARNYTSGIPLPTRSPGGSWVRDRRSAIVTLIAETFSVKAPIATAQGITGVGAGVQRAMIALTCVLHMFARRTAKVNRIARRWSQIATRVVPRCANHRFGAAVRRARRQAATGGAAAIAGVVMPLVQRHAELMGGTPPETGNERIHDRSPV